MTPPYRASDATRAVGCALLVSGILALLAAAGICATIARADATTPASLDSEVSRTLEYIEQHQHVGVMVDWADEPFIPAAMREGAMTVLPCENRTLDPRAISETDDHGLWQLNRVHTARANRMGYGWSEMLEPGPNTVVAVAIWQEQGWVWSCAR